MKEMLGYEYGYKCRAIREIPNIKAALAEE
jgi:hypothetical protein